jgi:hypothetical protein
VGAPPARVEVPEENKIKLISSTARPAAERGPVYKLDGSEQTETVKVPPNPVLLESLSCPDGNLVSYWHKSTKEDLEFVSPFAAPAENSKRNKLREKYITFEPDVGGWNNIRMQMEVVLVFALATGRTLVIPPEQAMVRNITCYDILLLSL